LQVLQRPPITDRVPALPPPIRVVDFCFHPSRVFNKQSRSFSYPSSEVPPLQMNQSQPSSPQLPSTQHLSSQQLAITACKALRLYSPYPTRDQVAKASKKLLNKGRVFSESKAKRYTGPKRIELSGRMYNRSNYCRFKIFS